MLTFMIIKNIFELFCFGGDISSSISHLKLGVELSPAISSKSPPMRRLRSRQQDNRKDRPCQMHARSTSHSGIMTAETSTLTCSMPNINPSSISEDNADGDWRGRCRRLYVDGIVMMMMVAVVVVMIIAVIGKL